MEFKLYKLCSGGMPQVYKHHNTVFSPKETLLNRHIACFSRFTDPPDLITTLIIERVWSTSSGTNQELHEVVSEIIPSYDTSGVNMATT
uniref:Uncharacterized protein n=1 Tax=Setaria italica TaxID=4555 RepID=K3ZB88_SETIT